MPGILSRGAFAIALLTAAAVARADTKDDLLAAADKLAGAPNYSWKTTYRSALPSTRPTTRPAQPRVGKVDTDGFIVLNGSEDSPFVIFKGNKAAVKDLDGKWLSPSDIQTVHRGQQDRAAAGRALLGWGARQGEYSLPAEIAKRWVLYATNLRAIDGAIAGDITEAGLPYLDTILVVSNRLAKATGRKAATVSNPKGSIKFWIKDGVLAGYETHFTGTFTAPTGKTSNIDRFQTEEIFDVGSTHFDVPEAARKILQ